MSNKLGKDERTMNLILDKKWFTSPSPDSGYYHISKPEPDGEGNFKYSLKPADGPGKGIVWIEMR